MKKHWNKLLFAAILVCLITATSVPIGQFSGGKAYAAISTKVSLRPDNAYHDDVYWLQRNLNALGYDCSIPDGVYGPMTTSAVKAFQKDYKLKVSGIANKKTLTKMNKIVENLQRNLTKKGFGTLLIDGLIGNATETVINRAKAAMGLPQNGIATKSFRKKLTSYKNTKTKTKSKTKTQSVTKGQTLISSKLGQTSFILQKPKTCKASSLAMSLNLITGNYLYTTNNLGNRACVNIDGASLRGADGKVYRVIYKSDLYVGSRSEQKAAINKAISAGLPIVVTVHSTKKDETKHHWVIIVGKKGTDYKIVDPNNGHEGRSMKANVKTMTACHYKFGLADYSQLHYGYIAFTS